MSLPARHAPIMINLSTAVDQVIVNAFAVHFHINSLLLTPTDATLSFNYSIVLGEFRYKLKPITRFDPSGLAILWSQAPN